MKSGSTKEISLSKLFPNDGNDWRVSWINGHIRKLNEKQPEFTVYISKIIPHSNSIKLDPLLSKNLSNTHTEFTAQIGYQNLLYIGSVWRNGLNVSNEYHYNEFCREIDTAKAQTISFDQVDEEGHRILKYGLSGQAFNGAKNSTIVALPLNDDPYGLLIPASEIIRFYYLISSKLSYAIYYGLFDDLTIGDPIYDPVSRELKFTLIHGVSKKNSPVIARYHSSKFMQDRVREIHSWAQINSIKNFDAKSNFTFFPFRGRSKLKFNGIEFQSANGRERVFVQKYYPVLVLFILVKLIAYNLQQIKTLPIQMKVKIKTYQACGLYFKMILRTQSILKKNHLQGMQQKFLLQPKTGFPPCNEQSLNSQSKLMTQITIEPQ